jgi:1-aminocyclopropane-1-carboxylate deaminase/D-cysteine desulfhydrase-like pyridoxal-dependent ACC family enzyme
MPAEIKNSNFLLPSPLQHIPFAPLNNRGINFYIKRDDLIHPEISGNKWRKLRLNIEKALQKGHNTILTFGGAHSNHIAATAATGAMFGLRTIGIIRGLDANLSNPTLALAAQNGMHIKPISREDYDNKNDWNWIKSLEHEHGAFYPIAEGGANYLGVHGSMDIMREIDIKAHRIFVACGTGTTLSGMALSNIGGSKIYGVSALKGGEFLLNEVRKNLHTVIDDQETEEMMLEHVQLLAEHHFGGYAKTTPELIAFMRRFREITGIKTDPVYTAKAAFAVEQMALNDPPCTSENWVLIHTGGLQGIEAMEAKLGTPIYFDC